MIISRKNNFISTISHETSISKSNRSSKKKYLTVVTPSKSIEKNNHSFNQTPTQSLLSQQKHNLIGSETCI